MDVVLSRLEISESFPLSWRKKPLKEEETHHERAEAASGCPSLLFGGCHATLVAKITPDCQL